MEKNTRSYSNSIDGSDVDNNERKKVTIKKNNSSLNLSDIGSSSNSNMKKSNSNSNLNSMEHDKNDEINENMKSLVEVISSSMREHGTGINSIEKLLTFLAGTNFSIRPRVLFIFDNCNIFLNKSKQTLSTPSSSSPSSSSSSSTHTLPSKPLSYKSILQNNTHPPPHLPPHSPIQTHSHKHLPSHSFSQSHSLSPSQSISKSQLQPHTQSPTQSIVSTCPALRKLVDTMLRRSDSVNFLNLITSKDSFFGLLSHEHEKTVKLIPLNNLEAAEFFVKISSPKCLRLPMTESSLFILSQMRFLISLQGNPKAIGTMASFLDNCCNLNNTNLPIRDNYFWINKAIEIHKNVINENYNEYNDDNEDSNTDNNNNDKNNNTNTKNVNCIPCQKNNIIDFSNITNVENNGVEMKDVDKDDKKEKNKEKPYDFNKTPGYDVKINNKNTINFGLLSSQLPPTTAPVKTVKLSEPITFLSSLPLPPPLSILSLKRSETIANTFLSNIPIPINCTTSRTDLLSHISLWAELTATNEKPHTPKTYVDLSIFLPKFEYLLFQILSVQLDPSDSGEVESPTQQSGIKGQDPSKLNENKNLKNNYLRKLSSSDISFLKQKIKVDLLPPTSHTSNSNLKVSSGKLSNHSTAEENEKIFVFNLPVYGKFLRWWLPLLRTIRKIKNEFCCVFSPTNSVYGCTYGGESCFIVMGFIDRLKAVELLKSGTFFLIFFLAILWSIFPLYFCTDKDLYHIYFLIFA